MYYKTYMNKLIVVGLDVLLALSSCGGQPGRYELEVFGALGPGVSWTTNVEVKAGQTLTQDVVIK